MRRPVLLSLVAVLALVATGCIPSAPPPGFPSGCGKQATPMVAQQRYLISGGVVRSYLLTVPDGYDPHHRYPLILNFHGHGSNAIQQSLYTQMDAKAKTRGFVVATPDGIDNQFDYTEPSVDFTYTQDLVRYLDAILCISELVTNAVHAGCQNLRVELTFGEHDLRVGVVDDAPGRPVPRTAGAHEHRGRGLNLVQAVSRRWGVDVVERGKKVWAEFATP